MTFNCLDLSLLVDDIDEAMERIGRDLRLTWRPVQVSHKTRVDDAGVSHEYDLRATASIEGPPAIELLERADGDWRPAYPAPIHHLGLWVTGLRCDIAYLEERGWKLLETKPGPDGAPSSMAYLDSGYGVLVELVDCTIPRPWVQDLVPKDPSDSGASGAGG